MKCARVWCKAPMNVDGDGAYRCSNEECGSTVVLTDFAVGSGLSAASKARIVRHRVPKSKGEVEAARMDRNRRILTLSDEGHTVAQITTALNAGSSKGITEERVGQIIRNAYLASLDLGISDTMVGARGG